EPWRVNDELREDLPDANCRRSWLPWRDGDISVQRVVSSKCRKRKIEARVPRTALVEEMKVPGDCPPGQAQIAIPLAGGSFTAISPKANEKARAPPAATTPLRRREA